MLHTPEGGRDSSAMSSWSAGGCPMPGVLEGLISIGAASGEGVISAFVESSFSNVDGEAGFTWMCICDFVGRVIRLRFCFV